MVVCAATHLKKPKKNTPGLNVGLGTLAEMVQNGATLGGTLNSARLLLPAVTFLMTIYNTYKSTTRFRHQSSNVGVGGQIFKLFQVQIFSFVRGNVRFADVRLLRTKRAELNTQGPASLSWTSSFFLF